MNIEKNYLPAISVLMAVFNGERWLADSIKSVLSQTYTNFEFIIINDGSNDSSLEIIKRFKNIDSRIRMFSKDNSGLADSLNYGIKKAKGEWIARIDADDICDIERLQQQLDFVNLNNDVVLLGSGLIIINENGMQEKQYHYPANHNNLVKRISRGLSFFPHSSAFLKLKTVLEVGGYRTQFKRSQDLDLWLRLSQIGKIACLNKPLVSIRKHQEQLSNDNSGKKQSIYSHMAMTSYFMRLSNKQDPIQSCQDDGKKFYEFINEKLNSNNYFDYISSVKELKLILSRIGKGYISHSTILIKKLLLEPKIIYRYIKFRVFGSDLPNKLANVWRNISNE